MVAVDRSACGAWRDCALVLSNEAIKTVNLIRSASQMMRREVVARVVLTAVQPGTNIAEHVEKEVAKAGLPVLRTRLHRLVAFQEMSFTGIPPTSGHAGVQCSNFLEELEILGGVPEATKLASEECRSRGSYVEEGSRRRHGRPIGAGANDANAVGNPRRRRRLWHRRRR